MAGEAWWAQARADMERIAAEGDNIDDEPDAWGYDTEGQVVDYDEVDCRRCGAEPEA